MLIGVQLRFLEYVDIALQFSDLVEIVDEGLGDLLDQERPVGDLELDLTLAIVPVLFLARHGAADSLLGPGLALFVLLEVADDGRRAAHSLCQAVLPNEPLDVVANVVFFAVFLFFHLVATSVLLSFELLGGGGVLDLRLLSGLGALGSGALLLHGRVNLLVVSVQVATEVDGGLGLVKLKFDGLGGLEVLALVFK